MDIYPIQLPEHLKVVDQAVVSAFVYAQTGCCLMNKSVLAPDAGALDRVVTLLQTLTAAQVQESNANKEVEMEVHKWFSSMPKPLTPELCKKLQWAYQRVGFQ